MHRTCTKRKRCYDITLSRQEGSMICHLASVHYRDWSAPTGLAIVHWIGCINAIKTIFGESRQWTLQIPCGSKIAPTVSKVNAFLRSRWQPKMMRKQFLGKDTSRLCRHPVGHKFHQNCSISHRFRNKFVLRRNLRWQPNMAGKRFLGKAATRLYR